MVSKCCRNSSTVCVSQAWLKLGATEPLCRRRTVAALPSGWEVRPTRTGNVPRFKMETKGSVLFFLGTDPAKKNTHTHTHTNCGFRTPKKQTNCGLRTPPPKKKTLNTVAFLYTHKNTRTLEHHTDPDVRPAGLLCFFLTGGINPTGGRETGVKTDSCLGFRATSHGNAGHAEDLLSSPGPNFQNGG